MTISVPGQLVFAYSGDGSTTVFSYPVRFLDQDEIVVVSRIGGVDTVKTLDTDYTVAGAGDANGGSVTTLYVPAVGETIILRRATEAKQIVNLADGKRSPAEAVEQQLDRLAMVGQDQNERISAVEVKTGAIDDAVIRSERAAEEAEESASRVDLGALDEAVETSETMASAAQAWAESPTPPGSPGTESAKTAADRAASQADIAFTQAGVATGKAEDAEDAADRAENAADSTWTDAEFFADTTAGLAGTIEGDKFRAPTADGDGYQLYRHDAGPTATPLGDPMPNKALVDGVASRIPDGAPEDLALAFRNEPGNLVIAGIREDGTFLLQEIEVGEQRISGKSPADLPWSVSDSQGFAAIGVDEDGNFRAKAVTHLETLNGLSLGTIISGDFSVAEIALIDQDAAASSASERAVPVTGVQRLTADINHVLYLGQSYAAASRSWPILTTTALPGTLMLGGSEHPGAGTAGVFNPMGGSATLEALVGTLVNGTTLLDNEDAASLDPATSTVRGESSAITAVRHLRRRLMAALHLEDDDTSRQIVLTNCAHAGACIEELSKGTSFYSQIASAVAQVKAAAELADKTYRLVAVCIEQGQSNYIEKTWSGGTATNDEATFRMLYDTYISDILADSVAGAAEQDAPPAFFVVSPAASYMRDAGDIGIGNAFLSLARETPGVYVVGSDYHVTDRASHLDANGSRWLGTLMGEAVSRVLVDGVSWSALAPIYKAGVPQAFVRGKTILLPLSVPSPPIQWGDPYVQRTASLAAAQVAKGFAVRDDSGPVSINNAEIVGSCTVKLTLASEPEGDVYVRCCGQATFGGNGYVRDSASFIAAENFEYHTGIGQEAEENIVAMVDKPYPPNNWIVPFDIPVTPA